ncbi:MAG TPA: oxygenase MpaB family protein [Caulobacteraceae bacterium]|jgi:uncharacterized protein (DUF2236 family)|nr:oxygenase MpaB family protein [Caulobacteraceae bacterium]
MGPAGLPRALVDRAVGPVAVDGPAGDPGLFGPGAVVWRVHANPVALAVGGVAAVILELAEPRVRTGVWEHSDFRRDPLARMRRTAHATLQTTFGATAQARACIDRINRQHARVSGETPDGEAYSAQDPELLAWVQATAAFGFLSAHRRLVDATMSAADEDRYLAELAPLAKAFGVADPPKRIGDLRLSIEAMRPRLQPHPILTEALRLISSASPLGPLGRPLQPLIVHAAIALLPSWAPRRLALPGSVATRAAAVAVLAAAAKLAPEVSAAREAAQRATA